VNALILQVAKLRVEDVGYRLESPQLPLRSLHLHLVTFAIAAMSGPFKRVRYFAQRMRNDLLENSLQKKMLSYFGEALKPRAFCLRSILWAKCKHPLKIPIYLEYS
jgi:hypothetical protein